MVTNLELEQEIKILKQEIRNIKNLLAKDNFSDLQIFIKKVQFNSDMKAGTSIGTSIIPTTGLGNLGFYTKTSEPIAQQTTFSAPSGGGTIDAEARTAIGLIKQIITNLGLTT